MIFISCGVREVEIASKIRVARIKHFEPESSENRKVRIKSEGSKKIITISGIPS